MPVKIGQGMGPAHLIVNLVDHVLVSKIKHSLQSSTSACFVRSTIMFNLINYDTLLINIIIAKSK